MGVWYGTDRPACQYCRRSQIIDAEVQRLLVEGYNRALDIPRADRNVLKRLAKLLLEKEVVERTERRERGPRGPLHVRAP